MIKNNIDGCKKVGEKCRDKECSGYYHGRDGKPNHDRGRRDILSTDRMVAKNQTLSSFPPRL
jgi:hypothetical protein